MKKITLIGMLAAVILLFTQCKNEQKSEPKNGETQVENQDKTSAEETESTETSDETTSDEEGEAAVEEMNIPLSFSGEKPTVKDIAIAMSQRFSPEVIGEEEAELENPGPLYEALSAAVQSGKGADGEEVTVDEEKGTVWFKQTDGEEANVLAVKLDGEKAIVDLRGFRNGVLNPAQFDGIEVYKIDAANKVLKYEGMEGETIIDDKGNLK